MSKSKIILIVIISVVAICLIDNIFSREEYFKGIITSKKYKDKLTYSVVGNNSRTGHTVFNTPTYDPNGYILFIKDKNDNQIALRSNQDTYLKAYKGDSVKYRLSKGLFSKKIWNSSIIEVIPNFENRKKSSNNKPLLLEELFLIEN